MAEFKEEHKHEWKIEKIEYIPDFKPIAIAIEVCKCGQFRVRELKWNQEESILL